jgi:hypothetical protein
MVKYDSNDQRQEYRSDNNQDFQKKRVFVQIQNFERSIDRTVFTNRESLDLYGTVCFSKGVI